jgi:signal transduction histidine kinase
MSKEFEASENGLHPVLSLAVHEFRTPVTVVAGYIRMLLRDPSGTLSERHRKLLEETERSCERLAGLVGQLSELANLEAGLTTLQRQDVSLFRLLTEVAAGLEEGKDRGVLLEVRYPDADAAVVEGDPARLKAALTAILNAALREKADASVMVADCAVKGTANPASAVIAIGDEECVRLLNETKPQQRGTFDEWRGGVGLTLPIARRIIEAHGGSVWAPSGSLRRAGTALSLPLKENHG